MYVPRHKAFVRQLNRVAAAIPIVLQIVNAPVNQGRAKEDVLIVELTCVRIHAKIQIFHIILL
jgi:hypothetical protein